MQARVITSYQNKSHLSNISQAPVPYPTIHMSVLNGALWDFFLFINLFYRIQTVLFVHIQAEAKLPQFLHGICRFIFCMNMDILFNFQSNVFRRVGSTLSQHSHWLDADTRRKAIIWTNKNIERHTAHTIVSWPNPKQGVIVHTSDMMIIRQRIYVLSIIAREMGKMNAHSPTYCTYLARGLLLNLMIIRITRADVPVMNVGHIFSANRRVWFHYEAYDFSQPRFMWLLRHKIA